MNTSSSDVARVLEINFFFTDPLLYDDDVEEQTRRQRAYSRLEGSAFTKKHSLSPFTFGSVGLLELQVGEMNSIHAFRKVIKNLNSARVDNR